MRSFVVVLLLLLSSLVPFLDGIRVVQHARLQHQRQRQRSAVLADSNDLVSSDAAAGALVGVGVGVGETAAQAAIRTGFCAAWGTVGARANNGYFVFSGHGGAVGIFWVPTAVAACPNALVSSGNCGDVCVGDRNDFNNVLNLPHIHFANYGTATTQADLRLSLKNRCTASQDYHFPAGTDRRVPGGCPSGTTGLAFTYTTSCTVGAAHAHATAVITAWNSMFT